MSDPSRTFDVMARTARLTKATDWHHVTNRGARKLPVFGDDEDRSLFLKLIGKAHDRFEFEIHCYALKGNHYHLLVRSPPEQLARSMQLIGGVYSQTFNKKYGLDGALFRGRYHSEPILTERHRRHAVRYIHLNPVPSAPMRASLSDFRWTSHLAYLGMVDVPAWLRTDHVLWEFGHDLTTYRRFIECNGPLPDNPQIAHSNPIPLSVRTLTPTDIEAALGVASVSERELLVSGGRGVRNNLRLSCVLLCRELTAVSADHLAERYGFASASGARSCIQRAKKLLRDDADFAAGIESARLRLRRGIPRAS